MYQNFQCETENSGNRLPSLERPHLFAQTEQKYTHWKKRRKPKQPNHERGFKKKKKKKREKQTLEGAADAAAVGRRDEGKETMWSN